MAIDERAKKILFDTYWTSKGWIDPAVRTLSDPDFEYAKSKGMMFEPLSIDHDGVMERTAAAVAALSIEEITGAFLTSLGNRPLDLRSGVASGSMAVADTHGPSTQRPRSATICGWCSIVRCFPPLL